MNGQRLVEPLSKDVLKVGVLQFASFLGESIKNQEHLKYYIDRAVIAKVDVIVLPELWDVGFFPENIHELAESEQDSTRLEWMKSWAKEHHINLVGGSIVIAEEGKLYNRSYVINREGEVIYHYDKAHLFSPGKEPEYFTPGKQNKCFELDGITCGVQICYDLRFPELARKQALEGAQIIFIPAQWPHPRSEHWVTLNRARAIENQVYMVAANGCGKAGQIESCGQSVVYSPWGEELVLASEEEGLYITHIELPAVDEARNKIPVLDDRNAAVY